MSHTLLIVDDEKEIREMLSRYFRMLGYDVTTAANGEEALSYLSHSRIDVVITDIMMPVMDGVSLLREIRNMYPMVRTIVITGYITLENALASMRLRAETCVFKPLDDLHELESAVSRAVENLSTWRRKLRELHGMKDEIAP